MRKHGDDVTFISISCWVNRDTVLLLRLTCQCEDYGDEGIRLDQ